MNFSPVFVMVVELAVEAVLIRLVSAMTWTPCLINCLPLTSLVSSVTADQMTFGGELVAVVRLLRCR
jgi:hypothetical protein